MNDDLVDAANSAPGDVLLVSEGFADELTMVNEHLLLAVEPLDQLSEGVA